MRESKGDPGGWGIPMIYEQVMNSPQSQKEIVGATVLRYTQKVTRKTPAATILFIFPSVNGTPLIDEVESL
jgi:hypothetical protein